jgi:hypothetical protein
MAPAVTDQANLLDIARSAWRNVADGHGGSRSSKSEGERRRGDSQFDDVHVRSNVGILSLLERKGSKFLPIRPAICVRDIALPAQFKLLLDKQASVPRTCSVIWRNAFTVGVKFLPTVVS